MTKEYNLNELEEVAKLILREATSKMLLFYGEMGSGKTTLIKALVEALGGTDEVSSPTFSIVNEYQVNNDLVYHFDLYRIEDEEEAYNFGIEDYLSSDAWMFIEWPERLKDLLEEEQSNSIGIEVKNNETRILKFYNNESQNTAEIKLFN
ncbi:tRNA (adenosine(37)-N6)-threonylcarbamoyltransferase complex ATPase subunit type 1 TsaE [Formosa sp. S-31]